MNISQSIPQASRSHYGKCRGRRAAHHAAKRAKWEAWMQAKAGHHQPSAHDPAVNVKEEDDRYLLQLFAAGFSKADFNIAITEDILIIAGQAKPVEDDIKKASWPRQEYRLQDFERKFQLNDKIDRAAIAAEYKNGVLLITLPKKEGEERKRHAIEVN